MVVFLLGALTLSSLSGFLAMMIVTYANVASEARKGVGRSFVTAFQPGSVIRSLLAANGLLGLYGSINLFRFYLCGGEGGKRKKRRGN